MPDNSSHSRITKLSPLLINQLAAGEVVTRPAAVVKELLENAIDAHATHIEVHITQGGMGMIEVVDNGKGIHPDDMVMAITRHATSKVADVANLHGITTLGFRGEALAATAAVSRLTLTSSHDDSGIGRQIQVAGVLADDPKLIPVVHNRGTTVTVKDLYFNVPARRGNLKSIATEFSHIETIVREVALARADVTLSLFHEYKKRLSLTVNSALSSTIRLPISRLEQALSTPLTDDALEIAIDLSSLLQQLPEHNKSEERQQQPRISGWLWAFNEAQSSLPKLLYVNGRLVKETIISNQLRQLAQSAQLAGVGYALYFELPNHWLNINVHPTKQRIKISPLSNIMAHLNHAISLKLKDIATDKSVNDPLSSKSSSNRNIVSKNIVSKNILSEDPSTRQQVQAPSNKYQLPTTTLRSRKLTDFRNDHKHENQQVESVATSTNHESFNTESAIADVNNLPTDSITLPQCLDVIHDLSECALTISATVSNDINTQSLPWILFYSQEHFLLINEQDWQQKVRTQFKGMFSETDETPLNPTTINQQIANAVNQLSPQATAEFKTTLEQILNANTFKTIDTAQLVTVMLSSASS